MSATENKQAGGAFDQLLGELDTMTKALPAAGVADDQKIQAAAAAAAAAGGTDDGKKPELDADGKPIVAAPMVKSFQVTLDDGSVVEAEDGTELVKSLFARFDKNEDLVVKSLGATINLVKSQMEQLTATTALVKSLQADVARLGSQGTGRKTLVNVHEQVTQLAKSQPQGPTPVEFMAKANAAFTAGKLSGIELTTIDVSLRQQVPVDQALYTKVMS